MKETSKSGSALAEPYLLSCDRSGRVGWISQHTHAEFGAAENLPAGFASQLRTGSVFRVWPVLILPGTLVLGAQAQKYGAAEEVRIEDRMVRNHHRLQRAEQVLSERVRRPAKANGGKLVRQIELERQRLGRELHTSVGQLLAAIRLQLEVIAAQMPNPPEPVQHALEAIGKLAGDALEQVRGISRRLHPPEWQRLTLESALEQLWKTTGIPERFQAQLSLSPLPQEPEHQTKVLLYRAAQEALSNIARHSNSTRVEMELQTGDGTLNLIVRDNGCGFDTSVVAPANIESGIGLRSLREQVADLGAKLEIQSSPDGTTLSVIARYATRG